MTTDDLDALAPHILAAEVRWWRELAQAVVDARDRNGLVIEADEVDVRLDFEEAIDDLRDALFPEPDR